MIICIDDDFAHYKEEKVSDEDDLIIKLSEYPNNLMLVKVVITKLVDAKATKINYDFTKSSVCIFSMKEKDNAVLNVHYSQFKI